MNPTRISSLILQILLILLILSSSMHAQNNREAFLDDLISKMTVKEKAGQMTQVMLDLLLVGQPYNVSQPHQIDLKKFEKALLEYQVGSVLNVAGKPYSRQEWINMITRIQEAAIKDTRLGIPVLYGIDAVHGVNYTTGSTLFPQQIGMAASWNPDLVQQAAAITAYECRASAIPWTFSPVQDLGRQPVWPRFWEGFGEDVYLAQAMGKAMVRGYEGEDVSDAYKVASCLKHFTGYSMPLSGKDRSPAWIPERFMREYFLPPFQAAIDAGAKSLMVNSGEVNGIPAHADKWLLTDVLRGEMGFEGVVVSDWEDIKYLHTRHKIAATPKEAVRLAIEAGIDMSMVPNDLSFADYLVELVEEGSIPESRLDLSVRRILALKYDLGLFENPVLAKEATYDQFGSEAHRKVALALAQESITLLKNEDGLLPMSRTETVLVTGPTAHSMSSMNGGWSYNWQGNESEIYAKEKHTVREALEKTLGEKKVRYAPGVEYEKEIDIAEAVRQANDPKVDRIILCLGEPSYCEFMGNINELNLPEAQIKLGEALLATGKPVTLVLLEGRPRIASSLVDKAGAVVMGYLPGNEGAEALVSILLGEQNPSGRLPYTYPRYANSLIPYDHKYAETLGIQGSDSMVNFLYPFGHGLSYTHFVYENLRLSQEKISGEETLTVSVTVTNDGFIWGKEVVQLYTHDEYASITPSVRRLRGFEKVDLGPGESREVSFSLTHKDLAFMGLENKWITEPGKFIVYIGGLQGSFEYE